MQSGRKKMVQVDKLTRTMHCIHQGGCWDFSCHACFSEFYLVTVRGTLLAGAVGHGRAHTAGAA